MIRYVLDTDISSFFIKGAYPDLDSKIQTTPNDQLCISVITRYELRPLLSIVKQQLRLQQFQRYYEKKASGWEQWTQ
jgi:predicted nucleic acid-binding protein